MIRKFDNQVEIAFKNIRWDIPKTWIWTTINSVGNIITGNTPSTKIKANYGNNIPFVKPPSLSDRSIYSSPVGLSKKGMELARMLPPNSVLVSCIGNLGKTGFSTVAVAFNQQINAIIFSDSVVPKYGFYYAQTLKNWLYSVASATTLPIVNKGKFLKAPIPIAPFNEQKLIVAEIEKQFSRLDEAVDNLKRIKINLKRYKASVLKAAVEGRLTEEWRKANPDVEPADKLLKRILVQRRRKWEESELAKMKAKGKDPKNDKWKKKYKEFKSPYIDGLPSIPSTWVWATPEQLAAFMDYALAIGPFGSNLKVSDYRDSGVPLVFVRNIRSGVFTGAEIKYISKTKASQLKAHAIREGDILITKMGAPPGDVCKYPNNMPQAIITADCIKWTLSKFINIPDLFVYILTSQLIKTQILKITKGVAQLKMSLGRFETIAIPVPPSNEQDFLFSEIERLMSGTAAIEKEIDSNLVRANRLRQSILKKAFTGRLVPQINIDESPAIPQKQLA